MEKDTLMKMDNQEFLEVIERAPLVAIDLIVKDAGGRILMGMRNNEPAKGTWFVPGGRIRKNETMDDAFERISRDELGIRYHRSQADFLGVFEFMYGTNFLRVDGIGTHYVVLAYEICPSSRPSLTHDEQHKVFRWFRDLKNTEIPFIMSSNFTIGDIEDEDINTDSEWRIFTDGGLGCSFG